MSFVIAVKYYYRVLQLTAVFWQSDTFGGNIYFAGDGIMAIKWGPLQ